MNGVGEGPDSAGSRGSSFRVGFLRVEGNPDLPLPERATPGAAGFDVRSAEPEVVLAPGEIRAVATGLRMELPEGIECQVRPRSGLALKHGVTVANAPGTIDPDFRGEVRVILMNAGREPFRILRGDRIAQFVFARFEAPEIEERPRIGGSERGEGGFGSTGRS